MKVDYVSDLHINHWMTWTDNQLRWESRTRAFARKLIEKGNGEVLVIAGDFGEWNCQALWLLDEVSKYYKRVYYTYGNHDLYLSPKNQRKKYLDSLGRLNELIDKSLNIKNIVPLIKNVDIYEGKVFAGDVMWYLPKTIEGWSFYRDIMSDSDCIKINGYCVDDVPRFLHKQSMDWYDTLENLDIDVFVSHVPPIHNPLSPFEPNTCYVVDVPFINTEHWICGHSHIQNTFKKAGVNFHMNAIGYAHDYSNYPRRNVIPEGKIDEYKMFEVKTFEI